MPPEQCPECGRFLSATFVEEATPGPEPCPNCDTPLSYSAAAAAAVASASSGTDAGTSHGDVTGGDATRVGRGADDRDTAVDGNDVTGGTAEEADAVAGGSGAAAGGHPLDQWGSGATAPPLVDEPAFALTPDELAMTGGGALLGALVVRRSRVLGAVVGALAALLTLLSRRE